MSARRHSLIREEIMPGAITPDLEFLGKGELALLKLALSAIGELILEEILGLLLRGRRSLQKTYRLMCVFYAELG